MKIFVHVRNKTFAVECAEGLQEVRWLGSVGIARYEAESNQVLGAPRGIRREGGQMYDDKAIIKNTLRNQQHVWVALRDDA